MKRGRIDTELGTKAGPSYYAFLVEMIGNLPATDEAIRVDMAVALESLRKEVAVRRMAESALGERQERFRVLVETSSFKIYIASPSPQPQREIFQTQIS